MTKMHRRRLMTTLFVTLLAVAGFVSQQDISFVAPSSRPTSQTGTATLELLERLVVKGRAPKTGYSRDQFGSGWRVVNGCDTRNSILARDLAGETIDVDCKVLSGTLQDPYTGKAIQFRRGSKSSSEVQIDHVVALSDAWQKGAQLLSEVAREALANDPLNLLAVDGSANQQKSDGDAATWLPSNKEFRCQYVMRQVKVKSKYYLWVTFAEKEAIRSIVIRC